MDAVTSPKWAESKLPRKQQEDRSSPARPFAGLQFTEGGEAGIILSSGNAHRSFAVCIQTHGNAIITDGNSSTSIATNDVFVVTPPFRLSWRASDADGRCVMVSGGPAYSLRFRPRPLNAIRLDAASPIAQLLTDYLAPLEAVLHAADPTVTQKLAELLADHVDIAIDDANRRRSTRAFLSKLVRAERYLDDPQFDSIAVAQKCGITQRALQKRFKSLRSTPRKWILESRLERIRRKLDDPSLTNLTIRQIALRSGFRDFSYFNRSFKEAFGVPPGQYRRR